MTASWGVGAKENGVEGGMRKYRRRMGGMLEVGGGSTQCG